MTRHILPPATDFFCVQECCSRIVQIEYQGQTQYTRILEHKPLNIEQYISRTQHRLELKFFHFAHFLHNAHQAARRP